MALKIKATVAEIAQGRVNVRIAIEDVVGPHPDTGIDRGKENVIVVAVTMATAAVTEKVIARVEIVPAVKNSSTIDCPIIDILWMPFVRILNKHRQTHTFL